MGSSATVLSPHLDDAVLCCWHLLSGGRDVRILNVFTAIPPDPRSPHYYWDRETGAPDSAVRMRDRLAEDRDALSLVGIEALNLDFLDFQYRGHREPPPGLGERIRSELAPGGTVYAPVAFSYDQDYGHHPDHTAIRDVALELHRDGLQVTLYLDLPLGLQRGRPSWLPGGSGEDGDEVAASWNARLAEAGLDPAVLTPEVHTLTPATFEQKLEAVRAYRTQLPELERLAGLDVLRHEVEWRLTRAAAAKSESSEAREAVER
jgi:LmbE family N-acetylglucosaminyl deacetylase